MLYPIGSSAAVVASNARTKEYCMFEYFKRYHWVLEEYHNTTIDMLLKTLKEHVIDPLEQKAEELEKR